MAVFYRQTGFLLSMQLASTLLPKEYSSLLQLPYKTTNLLAHSLADSNVYVSQVIVNGFVDGTSGAQDKTYGTSRNHCGEFWYTSISKKLFPFVVKPIQAA